MNCIPTLYKSFAGWVSTAVVLVCLCLGTAGAEETQADVEKEIDLLSVSELAERALVDTLYYNFDPWFPRFQ